MLNSLCKHIQSTRLVQISLSHPVPSSAVILISSAAARDRAFLALLVFLSLESSQSHCHSLKGLPLMCKGVRIPQVVHLRPRAPAFGARRRWRISVIRHCHLVDSFSITGSAEKKKKTNSVLSPLQSSSFPCTSTCSSQLLSCVSLQGSINVTASDKISLSAPLCLNPHEMSQQYSRIYQVHASIYTTY